MFHWQSRVDGYTHTTPLVRTPCQVCQSPCWLTAPLCPAHARARLGLELRPSPRHGLGLFTTRPQRAGTLLCPMDGQLTTQAALDATYGPDATAAYAVATQEGRIYDGSARRGLAWAANHGSADEVNAQMEDADQGQVTPWGRCRAPIWLRATRDLRPDEEVLMDYGAAYRHWDHTCRTDGVPSWAT